MTLINSVGSSFLLYNTVIGLYLLATVLYFLFLISHKKEMGQIASTVTFSGWVVNTAALVGRGVADHHAPWSNLYETLFLFSWASILGYMVMEFKYKVRVAGAFVLTLVMFAVGAAKMLPYRYQMVEPLNPALNSYWLKIHVFTMFMSYAAFGISASLAMIYLLKLRAEQKGTTGWILREFPATDVLDDLTYKAVMVGFPLLTLGVIFGGMWAYEAWGGYWSWDPKETWSLITWFVYAAYLHARMTRGLRGKGSAWFSILGFASVVFLYWGVSFIIPGLHAYAA
ncbi:MAG: c-type cytochrome biogenesis protein CcsB [Leptospirillum sp.]|jgi:cytochrome c-type biogenesis protein CcsB|nr:c-type cytochrome biogenesis protein CcsB [Nitrospiraceae bacterium]